MKDMTEDLDVIGWGEPNHLSRYHSPYYTESHVKWRMHLRKWCEEKLQPNIGKWEKEKIIPHSVFKNAFEVGFLPAIVGAPWPEHLVGPCPALGKGEKFDAFHELIAWEEICRLGSGGLTWGICEGIQIGVPPLLNFGTPEMKKVAQQCLMGEKVICLCISEPYAGSDVANIRCKAEKKVVNGEEVYVVNGEKKWITNGTYADYFIVAARTGGKGNKGISLLLVDRSMAGIETKKMDCMGMFASGTAYITLEDVHVPCSKVIGEVNKGFYYIMYNFNHERWGFIAQSTEFARVCLDEATRYALRRRTFGKTLVEHPVIRAKIGEMARQIESTHAMLELMTYQMTQMSKEEQMTKLAADSALIKVQATKMFEYCAREAAQIFGGNSYIRGGQGEKVERLYREVRAMAIPGGSEEIMIDLAVRQILKPIKKL
ncbi:acyl-CoA dehydrogenase [Chloropicon primus]|uniref:Acyl-CoA dehydrogenase n=1 Tax=Chloropicon primus TaxID=1764295 RepID=A0A5B8MJT6_9CHLO|nr:acyl-CoA dehydrogenase [Chloropicon primus]UPQ99899.1 acyl-CoA dehydrogenase [Chloropicon primus]|eukprot:QDZ20687.1 acyl-CoA dehydrogenase [Chloropicon primus]